jgi:hypothetical protein
LEGGGFHIQYMSLEFGLLSDVYHNSSTLDE